MPRRLPGKRRLAAGLLRSAARGAADTVRDDLGFAYAVPSLHEPIVVSLLVDGVYEPATRRFIRERLKRGGVFVDVGAGIGVFSIPAARDVGPEGRVLAIEAAPTVFGFLERNVVASGLTNVRLRQCAATAGHTSSVDFYEAPAAKFGMGSLADRFAGAATVVPARSLDALLSDEGIGRVDVVKVDVEGFEAATFRGAEGLLTGADPPALVFEFCDWAERSATGGGVGEAQRLLQGWGYRLWRLSERTARWPRPLPRPLDRGFAMLAAIRP